MDLSIVEQPVTAETLAAYATVSIAFSVESQLRVDLIDRGLGGVGLTEEPVEPPWVKDYDVTEAPARWADWWDLSNWTIFAASDGEQRVAGAVMAWNTPGVNFLRRRIDTAALWDIRVDPLYRGRGIGSLLFERGVAWARARGCSHMRVETQNINVRACRFYQARGCRLGSIGRHAYREFPDEVELVWCLDL
jgi:ribosomal protein S18 acetylase RimI-like enzyme